jgi:phosphoribosylformylglycinamidine synthase
VGAYPVGVTNCLNFGNPEKPEIMWQFKEVVEGIAEACRVFEIPVTGGNVSFYNETEGASIHPTPVLGIVGIVDNIDLAVSPGFKSEGDTVVLLGENREELGGTEYLRCVHRKNGGLPPRIDLAGEKRLHDLCLDAISQRLLRSAHDISEGGLAVCAAECAFHSDSFLGCSLDLDEDLRTDALLFGETQSRIVVTAAPEDLEELLRLAGKHKVKASVLGKTGGERIIFRHRGETKIDATVSEAFTHWKQAIPEHFKVR